MKIQLRNHEGQFCNLAEFCKGQPEANVFEVKSPRSAYEKLDDMKASYRRMLQLAEVIKAFDLPECKYHSVSGIKILSDGQYSTWSGINFALSNARARVEAAEKLAAVWMADSYEIED
jgi:hypothetical protein